MGTGSRTHFPSVASLISTASDTSSFAGPHLVPSSKITRSTVKKYLAGIPDEVIGSRYGLGFGLLAPDGSEIPLEAGRKALCSRVPDMAFPVSGSVKVVWKANPRMFRPETFRTFMNKPGPALNPAHCWGSIGETVPVTSIGALCGGFAGCADACEARSAIIRIVRSIVSSFTYL